MAISATSTQPREWNEGEQITSERLNSMIGYTEYVKNSASSAISNASQANTIANEAKTLAQTANTTANGQASRITTVENSISTISNGLDAMRRNLEAESTARSEADTTFNTYVAEIKAARDGETNLYTKIHKIDTRVATNTTNIGDINSALGDKDQLKKGYNNLVSRLSNIDTAIVGNKTYTDQQITARTVTSVVTDEIKERLDRVDGGRVDTTSSVADYNHSIRLRNLEKEIIDDPLSGTTNIKSNVAALLTEINAAHTALNEQTDVTLANRFIAINTALQNAQDSINIIANELEMLDDGELTSLGTRIDNISDEIAAAHRNVEEGQPTDTLVARFVAIENDVQAIAAELGVANVEAIQNTNTRIDEIESTITNSTTGLAATKAIADEALTTANAAATQTAVSAINTRLTTVENDLNTASTGLKARVGSTESNITSLDARLDKIDGGSALSESNTLASRVNALETTPKSATKVIETVTYNTDGIPTNIGETPSSDVDYLLKNGDKYYYWKYINNNWYQISSSGEGGGGTGNSNAEDYASYALFAAAEKELNKDYYVLQDDGFYHHYRYLAIGVNDDPIEIGTVVDSNNIKQYKLEGYTDTETNKNYIDLYQFNYGISTSELSEGTRVSRVEIIGGGSGGVYNTKQITRITPRSRKWPIGSDEKIYLQFFYTNGTANESDKFVLTQSNTTMSTTTIMGGGDETIISGDPANASSSWPTKQVEIDGETVTVPKEQSECATGFYQFDITDYCKTLGKQTFVLTITDQDDSSIYTTMTWEITLINLTIESDFAQNIIVPVGQAINFTYTPSGDISKIAHFYLGNQEIGTQNLTARTVDEQTYTIAGRNVEGAYQLRVYLSAQDNGNNIYSESIYRDLIWRNSDSDTLIISSPYRGRIVDVQQYSAIEIPYTIAGNDNTYTVKYYVNNFDSSYNEVVLNNTNSGKWTYRPLEQGTQNLRIEVENTHIDITLNVIENVVDIAPYTTNLVLNFDPTGLSNNSNSAKNWTDGTYHLTTSNNFDWFNGGYKSDETGDYFLIKSGTRAYFDYKMFEQEMESVESQDSSIIEVPTSKVYRTGQEMKIIFKTSAVRAIDAVWFTNTGKYDDAIDTQVGIQLSVHEGWLKTDSASDEAVGSGDEQVAATNTYLYFPYSEEDRIELDININKETADNAFAMSYEDGVPSKAYAYTHSQKLYHIPDNESIITIGSDDCDVYLYKLKIYNSDLTPAQVLRNFIADGKTVDESIERYQRNCIYYDAEHNVYSPYATSGFELNPEALASKIPNVKVLMLDTPSFTLNKKSFIKDSSLRCIHAPGGTLYPSRGAADNWLFEYGYHAGQGTTSDKYGDAGRNVDFLFNCDGTHKPSDKVSPIEGYISQVTTGYGTENAETSIVSDWKGTSGKISLTGTSVPNNFFNFKVNIASSENVNNALLQKRYNDFLPYVSPASAAQIAKYGTAYHTDYGLDLSKLKVKNDMEFVPAVLFVRENGTGEVVHSEFGDTNWHFYALGNLGDSKKTDYTRAYDPDDINEFTLEISDNNTNNSQFQTGVYLVNGVPTLETFEPEQDVDDKGKIIEGSFTAVGTSGAIAPTDYVYPLDTPELKAMWNATNPQTGEYTNKNHWSLVNEKYDGDHSFEMRYACCGDYRDGKKVNDTTGQADAQLLKNSKVWQAFYSWVVTASNSEFVNNLDQWCVRSAVEFWYAFTHYYTMMDNRAKNTFWHFAKTGKYRRVSDPIADMLHVYEVSNDATLVAGTTNEWTGTFVPTEDSSIVSGHVYYTQYAFDLWDYDNDTALGIDNNGELIFPYGKEDDDYRLGNDPASGFVFNGAGSIFWRRLRDLCTNEIGNIFNSVSEQFFSAENLIKQFDDFQECYPEALWQVDIQRKYIRPFTNDKGKTLPNGSTEFLTRQSKRFLESMMQGRKKYQRRQWIKDQYYYFGSKYKLNNVTEDFFYLDCYTGPDDALIAELKSQGRNEEAAQYVGSNWDLTITPYQDMYINASFGETAKSPVRAKAGEPIEMTCPFTSMSNTRIYIYGASRLKALAGKSIKDGQDNIIGAEGLASLYVGVNSIERTDKLQQLYFGTDKTTYRNANFTKLTLNENSPILEVLDIRNCGNLAGELKLGGCNNLTTLEAEGTNISLITLPSSSQITTLHLPSTITSLSLSSARKLTSFYMKNKSTLLEDYSNLRSLIVDNSDEHSTVNWMNIAKTCINNLNYLYLLNLKTSSIVNMSELEQFKTRKTDITNVNLSGILHVTGSWSTVEKTEYKQTWPNLELDITSGTQQTKHKVTYKYDDYYDSDGNLVAGQDIKQIYINDGDPVIDIWQYTDSNNNIVHMLDEMPSRASTVRNNFSFGLREYNNYIELSGWKMEGASEPISSLSSTPLVRDNLTIETYFYTTPRTYYVNWYLKSGADKAASLVKTSGNPVEYGQGYDLEAPTIQEIHNKGFETATVSFNGNTVTYSIFNGWEKLPTNINPLATDETYDIYANWYTNTTTLDALFTDTTNLSPEQLLVLSAMSSTQKNLYTNNKISVGSKTTYTLGHDSIKEGTMIVGPGATESILRLDFTTVRPRPTSVAPLMSGNDAFTLMIDYCFNANATYAAGAGAAALVSCYEQNSSANTVSGFALYYNLNSNLGSLGPRVGFGDMFRVSGQSVAVGDTTNANARNVVILRHPKGSSTLYVYSGLNSGTTNSEINVNQLTWNNTTANAVINLGQLTNDTSDEYTNIKRTVVNGSGTIYQIKYWNEDLGIGECKRLAAWPHEDITYMLSYLNTNSTQGTRINPSETAINLTSITNSTHGNIIVSTDSSSATVGWGTSAMRTFYNNRIYRALPIQLQAIICKPSVAYKNAKMTVENGINTYRLEDVINSTRDYVYAPSIINIQSDNDYINEDIAGKRPYQWLSTSSDVEVYRYNSTASNSWEIGTPNAQYKNLRFPYIAINWSQSNPLRIFDTSSVSVSNLYNEVNKIDGYIKVGDVCLVQDGIAYIYVNTELITQNGAQAMPNSGIFETPNGNGGWIKAEGTPLRSVSVSGSFRTRFGYITPIGTTDMSVTSSSSVSLGFNYEFAI